jgi:hypothetical protein
MWLTILLVVRLVARRASAAWVVLAVLLVGWNFVFVRAIRPATTDPLLLLGAVILVSLLLVWVLWKHGALAMTVAMFVSSLVDQGPWTVDASRWYAWRGWFEASVIVALVFWGFRNVLGKQSAFPAGALDGQ